MFCALILLDVNTRLPIIYKNLYKNGITCLMTRDFDILDVSGINVEIALDKIVRFNEIDYVLTIINLQFTILNSTFSSPNHHFSLFLITISTKTCSFTIFNSIILLNLISDSPVLIPQSFFPHTISSITIVDVNASYRI